MDSDRKGRVNGGSKPVTNFTVDSGTSTLSKKRNHQRTGSPARTSRWTTKDGSGSVDPGPFCGAPKRAPQRSRVAAEDGEFAFPMSAMCGTNLDAN
jgi:hypothetical protein